MQEFGGVESQAPGEGGSSGVEQLSEKAKQRFAAAAAGTKALRREEGKSKRRDQKIARAIVQFLNDDRFAHLFILISRLVARDCPSIFLLAILSLLDDEAAKLVLEYLSEEGVDTEQKLDGSDLTLAHVDSLPEKSSELLEGWMARLQMVVQKSPEPVVQSLMIDERNMDGSVLQLTTFVLQTFFESARGGRRTVPFEKLQSLTAKILGGLLRPHVGLYKKKLATSDQEENEGS
jgi:hypothetical protein